MEEDPVDIMPSIRSACADKCVSSKTAYDNCLSRVASKGFGACEGQYFDFLKCIDHCVRFLKKRKCF